MEAPRPSERAPASGPLVVRHRVHRLSPKVRTVELPLLALLVRPEQKRALHRSDEEDDVARGAVLGFRATHARLPVTEGPTRCATLFARERGAATCKTFREAAGDSSIYRPAEPISRRNACRIPRRVRTSSLPQRHSPSFRSPRARAATETPPIPRLEPP